MIRSPCFLSSVTRPLRKRSGHPNAIPGGARKVFGIVPEPRSPSARNSVRNHPGIAFGFIPEWRSRSIGFPSLTTGMVHQPILSAAQLASLEASPESQPFDGDPKNFKLAGVYKLSV